MLNRFLRARYSVQQTFLNLAYRAISNLSFVVKKGIL